MVGVCAALYLQRDGHSVFMLDPGVPGEGASFGNAGAFNASSVTPMAMPGIIKKVPGWLRDPLGPLSLRWSYLPSVLPYLVRFIRAGTEEKVHAQARALRPLVGATLSALEPLVKDAGAERLVHQRGHLYVYRSAEVAGEGRARLGAAPRERGRGRRVRRRRAASARTGAVARVCPRPPGARERPYQQPVRAGHRPRRAFPSPGRRRAARRRHRIPPRRRQG